MLIEFMQHRTHIFFSYEWMNGESILLIQHICTVIGETVSKLFI